jgi:hypothetical protein
VWLVQSELRDQQGRKATQVRRGRLALLAPLVQREPLVQKATVVTPALPGRKGRQEPRERKARKALQGPPEASARRGRLVLLAQLDRKGQLARMLDMTVS